MTFKIPYRKVKVYERYECERCGEDVTYVIALPEHMKTGHNQRSTRWCVGRLRRIERIFIPRSSPRW